MQQDEPRQISTSPNQEVPVTPAWFAASSQIPEAKEQGSMKLYKKLLILAVSVLVLVCAGILIMVVRSDNKAKDLATFSSLEAAYHDVERDLTGLYVTDIDDISPSRIQQEWINYTKIITDLKTMDAYKNSQTKSLVDEIAAQSHRYEKFVEALPMLYDYFAHCRADELDVQACKTYIQAIVDLDDALTIGAASTILVLLDSRNQNSDALAVELAGPEARLVAAAENIQSLGATIQQLGDHIKNQW